MNHNLEGLTDLEEQAVFWECRASELANSMRGAVTLIRDIKAKTSDLNAILLLEAVQEYLKNNLSLTEEFVAEFKGVLKTNEEDQE